MQEVWVVMNYDYSDTNIVGVFSTSKKAEEYVSKTCSDYTIEKMIVDKELEQVASDPIRNHQFYCFSVVLEDSTAIAFRDQQAGQIIKYPTKWCCHSNSAFAEYHSERTFNVFVPTTKDENTGYKIAVEYYQKYLRIKAKNSVLRVRAIVNMINNYQAND